MTNCVLWIWVIMWLGSWCIPSENRDPLNHYFGLTKVNIEIENQSQKCWNQYEAHGDYSIYVYHLKQQRRQEKQHKWNDRGVQKKCKAKLNCTATSLGICISL